MLPADSPFAAPPAPGPHPGPAELRAYAAGTLPPADEHRIEAHTLDCERCAELLDGFTMSDSATTDRALAELRVRLQARVAADDHPAAPVLLPAGRPLWPRLAAAVALLGAIGAGLWGWERPAAAPAAQAGAETTSPVPAAVPAAAEMAATTPPTESGLAAPSVAPVPPVSTAPRQNDYAVVAPNRRRLSNRLRVGAPAAAPPAAVMHQEVLLADATVPPAADEPRTATAPASATTPPTLLTESGQLARSVPDSARALSEVAATMQAMKARAAVVPGAALVANTPMPAAVAIAPAPITGTPALRDYLRREAAKFELEEDARPLSGTVRLRFMVGANGQLSNLQVVRGLRADYDEEALRLICEGPAWRPGIAGGRRAALPVEITVSF